MIQVFIRIVFRSIGWQEEHLNFILMLFQPFGSQLAMMDLQIVQDQEHFLLRSTNQTIHKTNQPLLVHGVLIDHKANLALTADCRNHIDPPPLRLYWQHGRTALRGKAALYDFTIAYTGLIGPIENDVFCFHPP